MGMNRYYSEDIPTSGTLVLSREESHHAIKVRREEVGNQCSVFDGKGNVATCKVASLGREMTLEVDSVQFLPGDLTAPVILGMAIPKGDPLKGSIEKCVELGVHGIVLLETNRCVRELKRDTFSKLERLVVESCKQCERNRLLKLFPPIPLEDWLRDPGQYNSMVDSRQTDQAIEAKLLHEGSPTFERWFFHPDPIVPIGEEKKEMPPLDPPEHIESILRGNTETPAHGVVATIGPEGGFTNQEALTAVGSEWRVCGLGDRILRVETAITFVAVAAALRTRRGIDSYHLKSS